MRRSDPKATMPRPAIDWRGWIALAWAAWFAFLYTRMILERRMPGLLREVGHFVKCGILERPD